ncbi:hypothetical protein ACA910_015976 [Epithemia clementina (nom. ined.)]
MQTGSAQRYIRVKRRDKTYCLLCDESQSIASIKEKLAGMIRQFQQTDNDDDGGCQQQEIPTMRLLRVMDESGKTQQQEEDEDQGILDDTDTLASAKILDNQVLHLVFCINEDEDEYEPVEVVSTELPHHRGAGGVTTVDTN